MSTINVNAATYKDLLKHYIETRDEKSLYGAEQITKSFIKYDYLPEEIVNLHMQALAELYPDMSEEMQHSMNFLLETMISYGVAYQEFQSLKEEQHELKSEIAVAADMQKTLLATQKPETEQLDIGVISVPANQMSGDYHHFVTGKEGSFGLAVADVIGKGVPAALCMSMIKYSMESFPEASMNPKTILENLNRVVERNVDPSIFITMFYGHYHPENCLFEYASAGHEPGFHYSKEHDSFSEIKTKGIVLGVSPEYKYPQYEKVIESGDMIILLTDGVTECRYDDRFIETDEVLAIIRKFLHLPAQELVEQVYKYFERLQNFQLRDDFTLIVLRKDV